MELQTAQRSTSKAGETVSPQLVRSQLCSKCWICSLAHADEGENGLKRFDKLIKLGEEKGVKFLLPLANNWADCGGYVLYFICIESYQNPKNVYPGWTCTPSTLVANTTMTYVS